MKKKGNFYISEKSYFIHDLCEEINLIIKKTVLSVLREHLQRANFYPTYLEKEQYLDNLCKEYYQEFDYSRFEKYFFYGVGLEDDKCFVSESTIVNYIIDVSKNDGSIFMPLPIDYGLTGYPMECYNLIIIDEWDEYLDAFHRVRCDDFFTQIFCYIIYDYLKKYKEQSLLLELQKKQSTIVKSIDVGKKTKSFDTKEDIHNNLGWQLSDIEVAELSKALIQAKKIVGFTDKDVFDNLSNFFGVKFNKKSTLQTIRKRSVDKTRFLDVLSHSLENWINQSDSRKNS